MLRSTDTRLSASWSSVIRPHWLTFGDAGVKPGCKLKAVFLMWPSRPGKNLRTKPQYLLIRLWTEQLEAVA
jgi:hypothetical protein